jgi:hypothetical protein
MCNCGHTRAAHLTRLGGKCWDHSICGCDGFYPEGLKSDEGHEAPAPAPAPAPADEDDAA